MISVPQSSALMQTTFQPLFIVCFPSGKELLSPRAASTRWEWQAGQGRVLCQTLIWAPGPSAVVPSAAVQPQSVPRCWDPRDCTCCTPQMSSPHVLCASLHTKEDSRLIPKAGRLFSVPGAGSGRAVQPTLLWAVLQRADPALLSSLARDTCSSLMATLHDSGLAEEKKNSELIREGKTRVRGFVVNIYIFRAFNMIVIFPFCV